MRIKLPKVIASEENLNEDSHIIISILNVIFDEIPEIFAKQNNITYKLSNNKNYLLLKNIDKKYYGLIKICIKIIAGRTLYENYRKELRKKIKEIRKNSY